MKLMSKLEALISDRSQGVRAEVAYGDGCPTLLGGLGLGICCLISSYTESSAATLI